VMCVPACSPPNGPGKLPADRAGTGAVRAVCAGRFDGSLLPGWCPSETVINAESERENSWIRASLWPRRWARRCW
jgi:hypothetical protein